MITLHDDGRGAVSVYQGDAARAWTYGATNTRAMAREKAARYAATLLATDPAASWHSNFPTGDILQ